MSKPTILLIPGSFHPPELWKGVQDPLHELGYQTSTLPLLSNDQLPQTHEDITQREATFIHEHVEKLLDGGQDVLVVMHSYGGVPGTEGLKGLGKIERKAASKPNGVVGLVYLCAFMLWEGARILEDCILARDDFMGKLQFDTTEEGWQHVTNPLECFYQDMPEHEAKDMANKLVRRDGNLARAKLTYPAYKYVPATYVHATKDQAIVLELQELMVQNVRASGVQVDTITWDVGHSPFFVDPHKVAKLLASEAEKRSS